MTEPTAEAQPVPPETSLQELFDMDPLKLSERDLDRIIDELRADRARYLATGQGTKQSSKRVAAKKEVSQEALDLLSDLGL